MTRAKKTQNYKEIDFPNMYNEYKKIYLEFINYYKEFTKNMNQRLKDYNGKVYLFGAHLFSQYLIAFGLNQEKIIGILDNSELKIGKRLYGTKLKVFHPDEIKNEGKIAVILKVATYRDEILEQIFKINQSTEIFE